MANEWNSLAEKCSTVIPTILCSLLEKCRKGNQFSGGYIVGLVGGYIIPKLTHFIEKL